MPEISVQNLVKTFGDQRALDEVSFAVEEGELFTLLGPSGCGKSTTLLSIAGFQRPDAGRITVAGDAFFDADRRVNVPAERRNLGIVFQSYAVWPHMTVFENLAFPLKVRRVAKRDLRTRVDEVLELVEMARFARRYPHQLSGGQQQRVALARALVYSPEMLLLDEPFSNLDAKLRERARSWVKELQQTLGLTTIFVTHDQDEALSMSDRIVVMDHGRVQQIGTPEDVYRRPANRFVAEFVGRVNLITGVIAAHDGAVVVVAVDGSTRRLAVAAPAGSTVSGKVTLALRPEAVTLLPAESTANGTNTWEGDVHAVAFLGDHYEYDVHVGALPLTVQSGHRVPGGRIKVHIPQDALSILADEPV
jgi:iron(III) transport system ATP-binding protein